MTTFSDHEGRVFMLETPERGAFFRGRGRVERINLDHIAKPVRLVPMLSDIKAVVCRGPGVAAIF